MEEKILREMNRLFDQKFAEIDKKFDEKFDEKFAEIDQKFDQKFVEMDKKFDQKFAEMDQKFDKKFNDMKTELKEEISDQISAQMFVFETEYGRKINIMFEELMAKNENERDLQNQILQILRRVDKNSAFIFNHENRVTALEKAKK